MPSTTAEFRDLRERITDSTYNNFGPPTNTGGFAPFMQKPADLLDTAFGLFGFLPEDGDPRWGFLQRYTEIDRALHIRGINFDNAWGAVYLSRVLSWRSGYITTLNPENTLQLQRALDNLEHRRYVESLFNKTQTSDGVDVRLRLTNALTSDPTKKQQPETPCPEALYQLRLYIGRYSGRVGFNLHSEGERKVVSVVNIQGVPDGRCDIASFQENYDTSPFNYLLRRVLRMAEEDGLEVRGLVNPKKGNSRLYYGVFRREKVPIYKAHHKTNY